MAMTKQEKKAAKLAKKAAKRARKEGMMAGEEGAAGEVDVVNLGELLM